MKLVSNKKSGEKPKKFSRDTASPGSFRHVFPENTQKIAAGCIALALVVFALYLPLLSHAFHDSWDDGIYVTQNERVLKGITPDNVKWAFSNIAVGFYYPITWLSHMTDVQLYGQNPAGHYFTNISIHALNVILLFLLLNGVTRNMRAGFGSALLFALHPMNVESVAWLAERKNLLSAFFLMLAVWAYSKKTTKGGVYHLLVYLFFIFGLMAKSNIVMFPVLLIFMDYWPLKRADISRGIFSKDNLIKILKDKGLLFLPSIIFGVLTIMAQKGINTVDSLESIPLLQRAGEAFLGCGFYLSKLFLPFNLCALYPHHHGNYPVVLPLFIMTSLGLATVFFWNLRRRNPVLIAGWMFFLVSLLPVIGLIQVGFQGYADRYVYFPYWGLFAILAFGFPWKKMSETNSFLKILFPALFISFFIMLFVLARTQLSTWKNDEALFSNMAAVSPNSNLAYYRLGNYYLMAQNEPEKAISVYAKALELKPDDQEVLNNLASCYLTLNKPEKVIEYSDLAIRSGPEKSPPHYNKGCALIALHREDEALAEAMKAAKLMSGPDKEGKGLADLLSVIGRNYGAKGNLEKAESAFREALKFAPEDSTKWCDYGYTLQSLGKQREATEALGRSVDLDPSFDTPIYQLALLDLEQGNVSNARARLGTLKKLNSPLFWSLEKLLNKPR
jgi:protein O-mannosyl-transferase